MKYVIEAATGDMIYALADDAAAEITADGLVTDTFRAIDIGPDTHEIITPDTPAPTNWGREWRWTGSGWVAGPARRSRIFERLDAIDTASLRPLRATVTGNATDDDTERLHALEAEASALRAELQALEA